MVIAAVVTSVGTAWGSFSVSVTATQSVSTGTLAAPTSLIATGGASVSLSWTATTSSWATGTRVFRSSNCGSSYSQIAEISGLGTTTYNDSPASGLYYYVVKAYYTGNSANWTSASSNVVSAAVSPSISLGSSSGAVGSSVTISGTGFPASSSVSATFDSQAVTLTPSTSTDCAGAFSGAAFTVPGRLAGAYTVTVTVGAQTANATYTVTYAACTPASPAPYISVATGNWATAATWAHCIGTTWQTDATTPTSANDTITIQTGNTVTVAANVTIDQTTVNSGGDLEVSASKTLTINNGTGTDLTTNGTTNVSGTVSMNATSAIAVSGNTFTIANGGTVTVTASAATFTVNSGATFAVATGGTYTGGGQSQVVTINSGGTVTNDGTFGSFGQFTVNGSFTSSQSVSLTSIVDLEVGGTLTMTGGTLTVTRGNGGSVGNINSGGSIVLQNSSVLAITSVATATFHVASGGTLDMGPSALVNGGGLLTVDAGGNLKIGSVDGITTNATNGNVRTTGTDSYSTTGNYTYDGTAGQTTGAGLPATVAGLTLSNSSGISTLTSSETVTTLTLTSGTLTTGANNISVAAGGTVGRTTGYVIGNLKRNVATGANVSRVFDVGTSADYAPVTLLFANVTTGGTITITSTSGGHPQFGTWTPGGAKKVTMYWTIANASVVLSGPNTYQATFQWTSALEEAGFVVANTQVGQYNAGWTYPTIGTPASGPPRTVTASGLTNLAVDFQIGN